MIFSLGREWAGLTCAHLISLKLFWKLPVKWLPMDMLADSLCIQQGVRVLEMHASNCALEVALGNHMQEELIGGKHYLGTERRKTRFRLSTQTQW